MPGETPEKGDKGRPGILTIAFYLIDLSSQLLRKADEDLTVSWNWGSGAPGGKVAETKEHGEIAIQSKRGNTIKKNAEPGNPAVHIERSGNDVVKKASELNVEEKASGSSSSKKREHKDDKEEEEGDGPITENAEGKDVKKQKTEKKSTKTDKKNTKASDEGAKKSETNGDAAPKKKAPGRPKGTASGSAKAKKDPKPRSTEGIGSRTRSRA